jgi:hypothetical protein
MHFNDVWMINFLKRKDFSLDSLSFHGVIEFGFLVDFDCELLHCRFFVTDVDHCIGTLADWLANLVVV